MGMLSPNTQRQIIKESEMKNVKKLGDFACYFSLLKGFVCTGIMYLPRNIWNGGWAFSLFALLLAYGFTMFCSFRLIDAKKAAGGSFSELGEKAMGPLGKRLVELTLFGS